MAGGSCAWDAARRASCSPAALPAAALQHQKQAEVERVDNSPGQLLITLLHAHAASTSQPTAAAAA